MLDICDNVGLSLTRLCNLRDLKMLPPFRLDNSMLQSGEANVTTARKLEMYQVSVYQKFLLTLKINYAISWGL